MVKMMKKYNYDFKMGISQEDFKQIMGREPEDVNEFLDFAYLCEKGVESQLDWDIIYKCAKEEMKFK